MSTTFEQQILGNYSGTDFVDDYIFMYAGCEKFNGKAVQVDFYNATLEVLNDQGKVAQTFDITYTLSERRPAATTTETTNNRSKTS